MTAAGMDAFFWKFSDEKLLYSPCEDFLKYDVKKKTYYMQSKKAWEFNNQILEHIDGIIPILYEYEICYLGKTNKIRPLIPIPINYNRFQFSQFQPNGQLRILHGVSRYGNKGTRHVMSAFKKIEAKFSKYVKTSLVGGLSEETMDLVSRIADLQQEKWKLEEKV